jgi:16S rRNA (adenine1518-N6/adenine1519-N6)-dimethyltransferase
MDEDVNRRQSSRSTHAARGARTRDKRGVPTHRPKGSGAPDQTPFMAQRRRARKPAVDVDALLRHANDPNVDLLAEAEQEIAAAQDNALARASAAPLDLANIATLRALLQRHGLRPNKAFGQHLLVDRAALDSIVATADLQPDEHVIEVGSGTGVLTVELAQRAQRVVAVEIDRNILPVLHETTARFPNVEIIPRDLLDVNPSAVFGDQPYKLVANLPYYITALTLRHFLEAANPPRRLVVLVQKEVAERITARPGDMSLLALSVQFFGTPRLVAVVPAASFYPPPKVDSAIISVELFAQPPLSGEARERFFGLAHAGFAERRKQLHNSLARNLRIPQETVAAWLEEAGIEASRRAETLSVEEWLRLTNVVAAHNRTAGLTPDDAG